MTETPCKHPELLAEIEAFCASTGTFLSQFGEDAISDRMLVTTLRRGRELRGDTLKRIRIYIASAPRPSRETNEVPDAAGNPH
jgi:hypothetical protein